MEELLAVIREQWGKSAQCKHCETNDNLHICSSCVSVFCGIKCQAIKDLCLIGGNGKKRLRSKEPKKIVTLTRDTLSIVMKFLELNDLKNASLANKKMTQIARQEMINRFWWEYTPEIMQLIKPHYIHVSQVALNNYENDSIIFESNLVTHIIFSFNPAKLAETPKLPKSIVYVEFEDFASDDEMDLSTKLHLKMVVFTEQNDVGYNGVLILPPNLVHLELGSSFNLNLKLPESLEYLSFDKGGADGPYNMPLVLPPNLKELYLSPRFNQPLQLGPHLTVLYLGVDFNQPIVFPDSIKELALNRTFSQQDTVLPKELVRLMVYNDLVEFVFPSTLEYLKLPILYVEAFDITIAPGATRNELKIHFV